MGARKVAGGAGQVLGLSGKRQPPTRFRALPASVFVPVSARVPDAWPRTHRGIAGDGYGNGDGHGEGNVNKV